MRPLLRGALCLVPMFAQQAAAQEDGPAALPSRARIVVSGCSERDERALLEQVRIELLSTGIPYIDVVDVYADSTPRELQTYDVATLRVGLPECDEPGWNVDLAVAYRHTGRDVKRTLRMSDIPETVRPRAVALGVVELLRANWRSLTAEPPTTVGLPALDPEKPPGMRRPARPSLDPDRVARPRIEWVGSTRIYPQTDSGDIATSLSFSQLVGERLRLQAGGTAAGGGGDGSNLDLFQAATRFALSLCSTNQQPAIEVGTAWEAGFAQLRAAGAGRESGLVIVGALQASVRVRVSHGVETLVSLQAGYVLAPLTLRVDLDDGRKRSSGIEGSMLGLGVGLAGIL